MAGLNTNATKIKKLKKKKKKKCLLYIFQVLFGKAGTYCSVCDKLYDPTYHLSSCISCFRSVFISSVQISRSVSLSQTF